MLQELGIDGSGPATQEILEGTYQPPSSIDDITKEYIKHLKYAKRNDEEVKYISVEDHQYDLKRTKEKNRRHHQAFTMDSGKQMDKMKYW